MQTHKRTFEWVEFLSEHQIVLSEILKFSGKHTSIPSTYKHIATKKKHAHPVHYHTKPAPPLFRPNPCYSP